jgi:hypothetical protein
VKDRGGFCHLPSIPLCYLLDIVVLLEYVTRLQPKISRDSIPGTASFSTQIGKAMRTILAISQDDSLLITRAAVLRKTNAEVIAAKANEAKKILESRRFDLVVLCHTLSPEETLEIASLVHRQTIAVPVLKVISNTEFASEWRFIGPCSAASCDPKILVETVAELLNISKSGSN